MNHEDAIIELIFNGNLIKGITEYELKQFIRHRVNTCLNQLGYKEIFEEENTNITKWFYKNTTAKKFHDFFSGSSSEYNIHWKEAKFGSVWGKQITEGNE